MANDDLRKLTKQERQLQMMMAATQDFVKNYKEDRDKAAVDLRSAKLDEVFETFCRFRTQIEMMLEDLDEEVDTEETKQDKKARIEERNKSNEATMKKFVDDYFSLKQSLQGFIAPPEPSVMDAPVVPALQQQSRVKLPELKLPVFNGNLHEWQTFRDTFKNLIDGNNQLNTIDKFTYLRSCLSGEALQEINSIEVTANNYIIAWNALMSRYENSKLLVKAHLDAIFGLEPMRKECFESLNHIISEVDKHLQMLNKLGETTENWSTLLTHLLANKLDSMTLRLWETHHQSRKVPKYKDMMEFLKNHCIVLQSVGVRSQEHVGPEKTTKVSSYSGIQNRNQPICPFCDSDVQHSPFVCGKFKALTVGERRDAARTNRLCFNCLNRGHVSKGCSRSSCQKCGQRHHTMLHFNNSQSPSRQSVPQPFTQSQSPPQSPQNQSQNATFGSQSLGPSSHPFQYKQTVNNSQFKSTLNTQHEMPPTSQAPNTSNTTETLAKDTEQRQLVLLATAVVICGPLLFNKELGRIKYESKKDFLIRHFGNSRSTVCKRFHARKKRKTQKNSRVLTSELATLLKVCIKLIRNNTNLPTNEEDQDSSSGNAGASAGSAQLPHAS